MINKQITTAMIVLIALATIGIIGIGMATQSVQGQNTCGGGFHGDPDDSRSIIP